MNHKILSITHDQLDTVLQKNNIVFIDFWASWCAPCKQFAHIYERVASLNEQIIFGTVNIEEQQSLAETFHIQSIPHLMVFKQGIAIYSESGSIPESTLKELVQQAIAVDVSGIRADLDKEDSR